MKKSIILIGVIMLSLCVEAQNPPVVEKAAPKSNNTLPSNGTLGSNSGVNPAGNPGTIISYSGNSNSINNIATPNPLVEKGVFLSSSPDGTVTNTTVTNGANVQRYTTITSNGAAITTTVETVSKPSAPPVNPEPAPAPNPNPPVATNNATPPAPAIANPGMRTTVNIPSTDRNLVSPGKSTADKKEPVVIKEKDIPAYTPLLSNFIPEQVIKDIKTKYGPNVYDIKQVKVAQTNRVAYLVRLVENGKFRNELFYDEK
ncbi:MAG: hypothetical protein QM737_22275 [Ferruginibacter sp.]